jgi:hypothetical protein
MNEGSGIEAKEGTGAIQNGRLLVNITEMQIWSKLSRGDYNRNQAYAHVVVTPSVPWTVEVPIGELEGPEAVREALSLLQDAAHAAVKEKASELERGDREEVKRATSEALGSRYGAGVEVKTSVQTIEDRPPLRPSIEAAVGEPPDDPDEDF